MLRAFHSDCPSAPDLRSGCWLVVVLCMAVVLTGCDDAGSDATWAPFASSPASEVDSTATVSADSASHQADPEGLTDAPQEIPPRPWSTAEAPADAIPALIAAAEAIALSDTAWPTGRAEETADASAADDAEQTDADTAAYTPEEAAALIAEAAEVLDARPQSPSDVSATAANQDAMVENLSDDALAAYEDPSFADDTDTDTSNPASEPAQLSLDMVIDETRSTQGRDFYNIFYHNWQAPEGAMNYTVYVREQPGRGQGSVVEVRVNDEIAFRSQLQPRYDVVEQTAQQAVQYTQQFMQRVDVSRRIY